MTFCYFKCAFEQLEKDIYLFIYFFSSSKGEEEGSCANFMQISFPVQSNSSSSIRRISGIRSVTANHVHVATLYTLRWPIATPSLLLRYRYADKTALLKGWRANRALARLFLETRASSKSLGRARNADVADQGAPSR